MKKTPAIPTEHAEQVAFVQWFEATYPKVRIFAIPNGGFRHKATAERLKLEGSKPGVPDLMIPEWKVFIEMKRTKGGRTSEEQKGWIEYLNAVGYTAIVCKGFIEAKSFVESLYMPSI